VYANTCITQYARNQKLKQQKTEHEGKILWNQGVQTDTEILENRPHIIVKNKDRSCLLTDVAIPSDRHVIKKEAEKKLKSKNLIL
jgi:hypothetical protein